MCTWFVGCCQEATLAIGILRDSFMQLLLHAMVQPTQQRSSSLRHAVVVSCEGSSACRHQAIKVLRTAAVRCTTHHTAVTRQPLATYSTFLQPQELSVDHAAGTSDSAKQRHTVTGKNIALRQHSLPPRKHKAVQHKPALGKVNSSNMKVLPLISTHQHCACLKWHPALLQ